MVQTNKGVASSACGVTPHDKEWGIGVSGVEEPSSIERTNKILKWDRTVEWAVDHERAVLLTEGYKKFAGMSKQLHLASAYAHVLENLTIRIYPDELIVSEMGAPQKSAPVFPEFSYSWVVNELNDKPFSFPDRPYTVHDISEESKTALLELGEFWKGNTVEEEAIGLFTEEQIATSHLGKCVYSLQLYLHGGIGHCCPDFETLLSEGYGGLRRKVEEALAACDPTLPDSVEKQEFYKAQLVTLDALSAYSRRYCAKALEEAKGATEERKKELVQIAENCAHIASEPPNTFWQALQLVVTTYNALMIESNGHSVSFGRLDQVLQPFFEQDQTSGVDKEWQQELLESFTIKIGQTCKLRDWATVQNNGGRGLGGTTITLGGVDRQGDDVTNDLTYMVVDALVHTRLSDPWLTVRWHENTPEELKVKCTNAIRVGFGRPKLFGDKVSIESMQRYGRSLEDARDYSVVGCVEIDAGGKEYGWHDAAYFSMPKVIELALNNGRCFECKTVGKDLCPRYAICAEQGKRLGAETGSLADFKTFEEVLEAYDRQMQYMCDQMVGSINAMDVAHQRRKPLPGMSLFIEGCIEKGLDVSAGGAKYNFSGPQAVGVATVADSLSVIKQLVFEEERITGADYLQAIYNNWEGYEWLHALVNSDKVHHYGNDDNYADELAVLASDTFCKHVENRPNARGGVFVPGVYSVTANVGLGSILWASIDGRKVGEPISDNVGAVHTQTGSHDVEGPTAMIKSVCKLDHARMGNGTLLNMKFSPTTISGDAGRGNFINLVDQFFEMGGMECQFNVISRETLEDAYEKPEDHKHLMVRVAGYSAFFNDLSPLTKTDIIGRTELSFD